MSRTVHHVTWKHRVSTLEEEARTPDQWHWLPAPDEAHHIRAYRYSAAVLAEAGEAGQRPCPTRVTRRLAAYTYPRTHGDRSVGYVANRRERSLRTADRVSAVEARNLLRSAHDLVGAAFDVDFADPRHRHFAVWDSW